MVDFFKKGVIQKETPARAEMPFCSYLLNGKHQVIPCSLCTSRWVFKQLYDKGLVYRGVKVMPFSTACNTPLSNFESHQNYKVSCNQILLQSFSTFHLVVPKHVITLQIGGKI